MSGDRIGKFEIISPIGAGGMADVYRCRLRGPGGFEKIVVVKRIRGERAADPCFVNMFLDEARLAATLNHPNIVQVFEIGEADGLPYIAMEYVKGPTLSGLLREARRWGVLPLGHVARLMADVCEGLHHAHSALAPTGEPLGLVHRDVSPQNVMVSREGRAKLLDFGVAKANGRLSDTVAGTLKGKLRYMAPEQLAGRVDHRADVFSVGVCLFEATTGQSPYGPPTLDEVALFHRLSAGQYQRPSELVPDYPPALEQIVLAAIEPDPDRRCPSARDLQDRLERFAGNDPFRSSTRAVAGWVAGLFPELEDSGPKAQPPKPEPARPGAGGARPRVSPFNPLAGVLSPDTSTGLDTRPPGQPAATGPKRAAPPRRRSSRTIGAVVGAVGLMVAGAAVGTVLLQERGPDPVVAPVMPAPSAAAGASPGVPSGIPLIASDLLAAEAAEAFVEVAEKLAVGGQVSTAGDLLVRARGLAVRDPELLRRMAVLERRLAAESAPAAVSGRRNGRPTQATAPPSPRKRPALVPAPVSASPPPGVPTPAEPARPAAQSLAARPTLVAATPVIPPPALAPRPKGDIYSARPLAHVPPPNLPRVFRARDAAELETMLRKVEQETMRAGCSPPFSRGITGALQRVLAAQPAPEIHPAGLYYLIVNEAAEGREKQSASQQLAVAHRTGLAKALQHLPVSGL